MRTLRILADAGAWASLFPVGTMTAIGLFADLGWPLDMFPHFAVQCVTVQLLAALYCVARRRYLVAAIGLTLVLVISVPLVRHVLPTSVSPVPMAAQGLRAMTLNVRVDNDRPDLVRRAVSAERPDLILLMEATAPWTAALAPLRQMYPYEIGEATQSIFSIVLLSRLPLENARIHRATAELPMVSATVCKDRAPLGQHCLTVLGVRAPAPVSRRRADDRDTVFRLAADLVAAQGSERTVLLGDLNAVPWSPPFRRLLEMTGLRDSAAGFGVSATFGSRSLLFGWPLDHVLVGREVEVVDRHVGDDVGSDHFPLVVDLAY